MAERPEITSAHMHYLETMRADQINSSTDPEMRRFLGAEWDRMMAAHDAEVRASVVPEIGMPCANTKPHPAHAWQMSATGWCLCAGVVAEEPEWEYGVEHAQVDGWVERELHLDRQEALDDYRTCGMNCTLMRRRKAGPWVPLKQEGADDA